MCLSLHPVGIFSFLFSNTKCRLLKTARFRRLGMWAPPWWLWRVSVYHSATTQHINHKLFSKITFCVIPSSAAANFHIWNKFFVINVVLIFNILTFLTKQSYSYVAERGAVLKKCWYMDNVKNNSKNEATR